MKVGLVEFQMHVGQREPGAAVTPSEPLPHLFHSFPLPAFPTPTPTPTPAPGSDFFSVYGFVLKGSVASIQFTQRALCGLTLFLVFKSHSAPCLRSICVTLGSSCPLL